MKKILLVLFLMAAAGPLAYADDASSAFEDLGDNSAPGPSIQESPGKISAAPLEQSKALHSGQGQLIDMTNSRVGDELEDLRRRIVRLEQDTRSQDQEISSLKREIDDIRRRHLR